MKLLRRMVDLARIAFLQMAVVTLVGCVGTEWGMTDIEPERVVHAVGVRQVTDAPRGHILTNCNVWSPDGRWIVYDVRSDPAGTRFDGQRIERVNIETGDVEVLYATRDDAHCGVVTYSPVAEKVVFIHGPEHPTAAWQYAPYHRRGVIVETSTPGQGLTLDARDLTSPFTPGALRGGTHVHVFSPDGQWISFTYEDHVLAFLDALGSDDGHDRNQRNVGVSIPSMNVAVPKDHPRNHDGVSFSVLVTQTVNDPTPGSEQICRAFEEAWVGRSGYRKSNGTWQRRALAFQGHVVTQAGRVISEAFIVDMPEDLTRPGEGPLAGTAMTRPQPPAGCVQRRLTFTAQRKYPGLQGPRHWLRSSPNGSRIAFLMKDDEGIVQIWTVSPNGGEPLQLTHNRHDVASAFTWSPDGRFITHVMDDSVCLTETDSGRTHRLTARCDNGSAPRPEACVFSPDGSKIAYIRPVVRTSGEVFNQVFVVELSTKRDF